MRSLCVYALTLVCCGPADAQTAQQAALMEQQTQPDASVPELRASCAPLLSEIEPVQRMEGMDGSALSGEVIVASSASERGDCSDYGWIRGSLSGAVVIEPEWDGPKLTTSAWDCSHSTLEYGVYLQSAGRWQYVGGALAFGELSEAGVCRHSVENFPRSEGSDSAVVFAQAGAAATEMRVGVRAWSHNDPAMGHPGHDCEELNCYWPVILRWHAY
ncbi:MAG TPA: hypothetical protein VL137_04440 [Polyangiaceae bacterium]|nr:hypothetical protein [Polyangiaceae bacterium]